MSIFSIVLNSTRKYTRNKNEKKYINTEMSRKDMYFIVIKKKSVLHIVSYRKIWDKCVNHIQIAILISFTKNRLMKTIVYYSFIINYIPHQIILSNEKSNEDNP